MDCVLSVDGLLWMLSPASRLNEVEVLATELKLCRVTMTWEILFIDPSLPPLQLLPTVPEHLPIYIAQATC